MRRIHIVGQKNAGKTTLVVELVHELTRRGYRVGTIKHTRHEHELDTPGKDSDLHRRAGGSPSAIISGGRTAIHLQTPARERLYEDLAPHYEGCDLVLVEGDWESDGPKVEVWRPELGRPPRALGWSGVGAVVADDPASLPIPAWPRSRIDEIADRLLEMAGVVPASEPCAAARV